MPYRILSHTADAGVEATAATLPGLVEALAEGMFALVAGATPRRAVEEVTIVVAADTPEDLVVEALSDLLWRSEVDGLAFCEFAATQTGPTGLEVTARGVPAGDVALEGAPVKAVTYHDLVVREEGDGWYGRVIFDV